MFFILSKLLNFLIAPLSWIIALLVWSLLTKSLKRKRILVISVCSMLYLFSNAFLFNEVMGKWELQTKKYSQLKTYDVGIVLGGMLAYDGEFDRLMFMRGTDRIMQAIELYKRGYIKKILYSGGSGSILRPDFKEAIYARRYLLTLGIPDSAIIIETESNNTRENALFSKAVLQKQCPQGKFLLITSAFHMRRAMGCFNKVGVTTDYYSTDRYSGLRAFVFDNLLIPNVGTLLQWHMLLHEMTGFVVYKISGYA